MQNFSPMKPRQPGTIWSATSRAMNQLGGAEAMAAAVDRKPWWAYTVSDEDAAANARTNLSFADACSFLVAVRDRFGVRPLTRQLLG